MKLFLLFVMSVLAVPSDLPILDAPLDSDALKCHDKRLSNTFPGYEDAGDGPVIVVDDRVPGYQVTDLERVDVGWIQVRCWNPETGRMDGAEGIDVVHVLTNEAYRNLEAVAIGVIERQREAHAETGRWIRDLDELQLEDLDGVRIQFHGGIGGWHLALATRYETCIVSDQLEGELGERDLRRRGACVFWDEPVNDALAAAWRGGGVS